jgi:hypothetical protein
MKEDDPMPRLIFAAVTLITLHILNRHLAIVAISTEVNAATAQLPHAGARVPAR